MMNKQANYQDLSHPEKDALIEKLLSQIQLQAAQIEQEAAQIKRQQSPDHDVGSAGKITGGKACQK